MMEETPRHIAAELLKDLADQASDLVRQMIKVPPRKAEDFGKELAFRIAENWGGQNLYIPMDMAGRRSERNEQIYKHFNGTNQAELALEHKLSVQMVYRIVKAMRAERAMKQHSLFG